MGKGGVTAVERHQMGAVVLLLVVFIACLLIFLAAAAQLAVEDRQRGLSEGERRGVSIVPIIPVYPLAIWGFALLLDMVADPWGNWIIGSIHVLVSTIALTSIARDTWRLRSLHKPTPR
jgi:hypothetical protein